MLDFSDRIHVPSPDTQEARTFLFNHYQDVDTAVMNKWNNANRELGALVLFFNQSGEIIYDTTPVNGYTALINCEIDTQKTGLFGCHSASGEVKVYLPYLNRHTGEITDYNIYKWLVLYYVDTSVTDGETTVNFRDYTPTQFMYVSGEEKDNSDNIITYKGYDWLESNQNSWADYLVALEQDSFIHSLSDGNPALISLFAYINTVGATTHPWLDELYYQQMEQSLVNFSASQSSTIRGVLDAYGEAYGIDIVMQTDIDSVYEITASTFSEAMYITPHDINNMVDVNSNLIYNFQDKGDGNSVRINKINIKNNLGNKMVKEVTLTPYPTIPTENATYYLSNNPILSLQPYEALVGETPLFTLVEYADLLLHNNEEYRSISDAVYYPCYFEWVCNPMYQIGDTLRITWNNNTYYTVFNGGNVRYNGGLRCEIDLSFIGDMFIDNGSVETVGSAVNRIEANIDYNNNQIQLLAEKIPDNLGEAVKKAEQIITADGIKQIVSETTNTHLGDIDGEIASLKKSVEVITDSKQFSVAVNSCVNNVQTNNGMSFNSDGLNITRSGASTYTNVNETGLHVKQAYGNETEMLTADAKGVKANTLEITNGAVIGNFKIIDNGNKIAFYFLG